MIRDQNKDEKYFDATIDGLLKENEYFVKQVAHCNKWKKNKDGIERMNAAIDRNTRAILISQYSRGDDICRLIQPYREYIESMPVRWRKNYLDILWMMAIGIMLDIDQDTFEILIELSKKHGLDKDYLICFFSDYKQKNDFDPNGLTVERTQLRLVKQIVEGEPTKRESLFINYIEKKWYPSRVGYYWYESHKISYGALHEYFGYWCFEGGAVAKILGIDDAALKNCKYYPYDLVHYIPREI